MFGIAQKHFSGIFVLKILSIHEIVYSSRTLEDLFGSVIWLHLLHDPFSWRNILGILIAIVGMGLYSYFCVIDSQVKQSELLGQLSQVKDGETEPLIILKNGANKVNDNVGPKGPMWASNKDLHA